MMRTRLSEGFLLEDYLLRFKEDFISGREEKIKSLIDLGYVKISEGRFYFTDQGMYVGNSLLTELI
jgi:coproporphyrinogen III oxidase-like Fe-S oxidoreductase